MIAAKETGVPVVDAQVQPGAPILNKSAAGIKKVSTWCTQKLFFLAGLPVLPALPERLSWRMYPGTRSAAVSIGDLLRVPGVGVA
jgi:hypothetical protein